MFKRIGGTCPGKISRLVGQHLPQFRLIDLGIEVGEACDDALISQREERGNQRMDLSIQNSRIEMVFKLKFTNLRGLCKVVVLVVAAVGAGRRVFRLR